MRCFRFESCYDTPLLYSSLWLFRCNRCYGDVMTVITLDTITTTVNFPIWEIEDQMEAWGVEDCKIV